MHDFDHESLFFWSLSKKKSKIYAVYNESCMQILKNGGRCLRMIKPYNLKVYVKYIKINLWKLPKSTVSRKLSILMVIDALLFVVVVIVVALCSCKKTKFNRRKKLYV